MGQSRNGNGSAHVTTVFGIVIGLIGLALAFYLWMSRPKIGVVQTSRLLEGLQEWQSLSSRIKAQKDSLDKNVKALEDSARAYMDTVKLNYNRVSDARKAEMRKALDAKNEDLSRYSAQATARAREFEERESGKLIEKINENIALWGKRHGYTVILGSNNLGGVLMADPAVDVTNRILPDLNKELSP